MSLVKPTRTHYVPLYVHMLCACDGLFEVKADEVGSLRDRQRP